MFFTTTTKIADGRRSLGFGLALCKSIITAHEIRGSAWDNDVESLRMFMATLRKKIESDSASGKYIQTHAGVGYRMLRV